MNTLKGIGLGILILTILLGLSIGFGWFDVFYTKTIGKAKKNADTEVYYETQSFVTAKKQEALKWYQEYQNAESFEDRQGIRKMVSLSFADFDEEKLPDELYKFVRGCKYGN